MELKCDYCGNLYSPTTTKKNLPRLLCCDECAKQFISYNLPLQVIINLGVQSSRAKKLGWHSPKQARKPFNCTCKHCGTEYECVEGKTSRVKCCDACARKFIENGLKSQELMEKGVSYHRAILLGWAPRQVECGICHRLFSQCASTQTLCRLPGCPSSLDKASIYHPLKIRTKHEKKENEPACKTVICTPMNKYRDRLLEKFPGLITEEQFNETRKKIMEKECKSYINPRCAAAGIFYITMKRFGVKTPVGGQLAITDAIDTTTATMRKMWVKYKDMFDELKETK